MGAPDIIRFHFVIEGDYLIYKDEARRTYGTTDPELIAQLDLQAGASEVLSWSRAHRLEIAPYVG